MQNWELAEKNQTEHGYDELAEDKLSAREVLDGVPEAILVEEYPDVPKGPSALFLQKDRMGMPVHGVWGIPKGYDKPVVDDVRDALRRGDIEAAAKYGRIYELRPVAQS